MVKQVIQQKPTTEVEPKNKVNRFEEKPAQPEAEQDLKSWKTSAVVYIGHLPYGFFEQELKAYFSQFGDVLAVKICRSKKTARSKGFGFVQFRYAEVAKIAADAMNNYLILGKILVCKTLQGTKKNPFLFKEMRTKTKFINWKKIFVIQKNKKKTQEQLKIEVQKLLVHQQQKRNRFQQLGIKYTFPGFKAILKK